MLGRKRAVGANISFLLGCVLLWVALLLTPWTFNDSLIVCISLWVVSVVLLTLESKNLYLQSMYYDLEIELQSGEKIVCPKFDSISNLRGKIRVIKSLYNKRESEVMQ